MIRFLTTLCIVLTLNTVAWAEDMRVYTELTGNAVFKRGYEIKGGDVNLVREIMERVGTEAEIEVVPWKRGYEALLHEPNVALFPTTLTKERAAFSLGWPVVQAQMAFLGQEGIRHQDRKP